MEGSMEENTRRLAQARYRRAVQNFSGHTDRLDRAIMKQAYEKLVRSIRLSTMETVARYFFPDGKGIDERDACSFQHLCMRNNVDPDWFAKQVWESLSLQRQTMVRAALTDYGFICK